MPTQANHYTATIYQLGIRIAYNGKHVALPDTTTANQQSNLIANASIPTATTAHHPSSPGPIPSHHPPHIRGLKRAPNAQHLATPANLTITATRYPSVTSRVTYQTPTITPISIYYPFFNKRII